MQNWSGTALEAHPVLSNCDPWLVPVECSQPLGSSTGGCDSTALARAGRRPLCVGYSFLWVPLLLQNF